MTTNPYESPEALIIPARQRTNWPKLIVQSLVVIAILAVLGALLLPVSRLGSRVGSREAARRAGCANNLRNISLALQNYESTYGCLPPAYTVDESGKPLHSWRTLILPFLEQKALYDQIDLSKPWDDPANRAAYETSPRIYDCPSSTAGKGKTTYFAVVAPGGCFKSTESRSLADITDHRDLTLMIVEVPEQHAAPWMSPNDATEEMILDGAARGDFSHPNGALAACVSGRVLFISINTPDAWLRALISIDGNDDSVAQRAD
jgi:type II secretory pathway pseudopilin PulG